MVTILDEIVVKLEKFIRKYLWFKVLKGLYLTLGLIILIVITVSIFEYFNYFNTKVKTFLFLLTISSFIFLFVFYLLLPLLSIVKIRNTLGYREAALIVSKHFPEISDKLLNTLELGGLIDKGDFDSSLIIASINKRTEELRPFAFTLAVSFGDIKRYFFLFIVSVFVLACVFAFTPKVFTNGTLRLVKYSTYFEPEAPFQFKIMNENLICEKGKDFILDLKITGSYIPENVFIKISGNSFLMTKSKEYSRFGFVIRNINNSVEFNLNADNYNSKNYEIKVLPAPLLKSFYIDVIPPSYVGMEMKRILNTGDITVPCGSVVVWNFSVSNVTYMDFIFQNDTSNLKVANANYSYKRMIKTPSHYRMVFGNQNFSTTEPLEYSINVIPDLFPEIDLRIIEDSLKVGAYYFMVGIKDDYGFKDLNFVRKTIEEDSLLNESVDKISINALIKNQDLFHYFDFSEIKDLNDNSLVEYYFEVRDNDMVSGFKAARTLSRIYKPFSRKQIRNDIDKSEKLSEQALSKSKKLTGEIEKEIEEFKRKELSNDLNEWDKQNYMKSILEKQRNLDKFIEDLKKEFQKTNKFDNQFYEDQKSAIEKQKQIQELLDQILDDELKKLIEEIRQMTEKFDEKQFEQIKDKIDFSYKNMEKKLDRTLELLKRYQIEDNITRLAEDVEKLSEDQKSLSEEKINKKDLEKNIDDQKKVKDEFNELDKEFKETFEKNKELKSPFDMDDLSKSFDETEKNMENLEKEMPTDSKKEIQKKQNKISEEMKKIADEMNQMVNEMSMESNQENMEDLRQLIDNLTIFSFGQEDVYNLLNKNLQNSPSFPDIISKQNKLRNDFQLVNDSLNSLAGRIPILGQNIVKESDLIRFNLDKVNDDIEDRKRRESLSMQRLIMNSTNTLALMLDELMQQMQNQGSGGSGANKKGGKPQQMESLKKQQDKLKKQLQELLDEMKNNEGKPGNPGMNDQIVKSLAEQEILNKMLKDIQNGKDISPETDQKLKEIKNLSDKNIEDLINKRITPELYNRNQKILTRLLEAEKSEREREQEKKRESKEGKKDDIIIPYELKESMKKEERYKESLQKNNLNLKKYYQNLNDSYFRNINN